MEDPADLERSSGYRRHNTRPYELALWHSLSASRAALGAYILAHRNESQAMYAKRAGMSVLSVRAIEYGQSTDYDDVKLLSKFISPLIGDEKARELRLLYKALSRSIARIEAGADDDDKEDVDG